MNLFLLLPEISLIVIATVLILLDLIVDEENKSLLGYLAFIGLIFPFAFTLMLVGRQESSFANALVVDPLAIFFNFLFIVAAALVLLASIDYAKRMPIRQGEYYALVLFATAGMMFMAGTRDLISIYISIEMTSITLYILAASIRNDQKSSEAGLKYLLLGALSSAALLYGMALIYGSTGTTMLNDIALALTQRGLSAAAVLGLVFLAAGFGFKIATVPFHMWAPDVYEGAPTPITAFLAVASKAAGFAVVMRVFAVAFGPAQDVWPPLFAGLAAITMTLGNVVAVRQDNIKRMLAYSSIAHAGYLAMGLASATANASSGILVYLAAYAVTNMGAFAAIIAFSNHLGSDEIKDYAGLFRRAPLVSIGLSLCLLSLAGIPPMAGFISKVYLFLAAYQAGWLWLVVLGLFNSAISMYYYVRVVRVMFLGQPSAEESMGTTANLGAAIFLSVAALLVLGVYPAPLLQVASQAAQVLFP
ncbi:MAG: NADH-quinone oxidoreductase subunit N [Chloroflexi bacterium]|nr:NADH-quinone oxidoreductase subunit N [Chloroflexota bacterium]